MWNPSNCVMRLHLFCISRASRFPFLKMQYCRNRYIHFEQLLFPDLRIAGLRINESFQDAIIHKRILLLWNLTLPYIMLSFFFFNQKKKKNLKTTILPYLQKIFPESNDNSWGSVWRFLAHDGITLFMTTKLKPKLNCLLYKKLK